MTTAPAAKKTVAVKTPAKPAVAKKPTIYATTTASVDPRTITRKEGHNPRFEFGDIEALARSIKTNGLLMPLRVRKLETETDGKLFTLVDGDRRLTAIESLLKAGTKFPDGVQVTVVDNAQDAITDLVQMFETNASKQFLPLEKAAAFQRMREAGLTIPQISARTSCNANDIVGSFALLEADDSVITAVKEGKISGAMARDIAVNARSDKKKQAELAKEAADAGKDKTKRKAIKKKIEDERQAKAARKGRVLKMRALSDEDLAVIGTKLAEKLKEMLGAAGMDFDADLRQWATKDNELKLAFTFGALEGLKAAAGVKVSLDL